MLRYIDVLFAITQYNSDTHNARTLTLWTHMHTNPTPISIFEEEAGKSLRLRLAVDENIAYHWKHNAVKF